MDEAGEGHTHESFIANQGDKSLSEIKWAKQAIHFVLDWQNEDKTYFDLQTSGTTGAAKSIKLSRNELTLSALRTAKVLGLKETDRALIAINTSYIGGLMMLVRCMITGMEPVIVEPRRNPLDTLAEAEKIDFAAFVPMQIQEMLEKGMDYRLNQIRNIIIGGASITPFLESSIRKLKTKIYETFGMTETVSHIALRELSPIARDYFVPLEGIRISQTAKSELIITLQDEGKEIKTNDLIEVNAEGHFKWKGRTDNVINTGGIKISIEELEIEIGKIFEKMMIGNRYFVYTVPDEVLGSKIVLLIEGTPFIESLMNSLQLFMQKLLPLYTRPKNILFLKKFKETPTGKMIMGLKHLSTSFWMEMENGSNRLFF
jgi:O-succinylbenzoic acid--CoA ligase